MKNRIYIVTFIIAVIFTTACTDLDLTPLSEGSSENWYSDQTEIEMALNDLYCYKYRDYDVNQFPTFCSDITDDWTARNSVSYFVSGVINGETIEVERNWEDAYRVLAHANAILANIDKAKDKIPAALLERYKAEARFFRGFMYGYLTSLYGDVVYIDKELTIEEAFELGRTDKNTILQKVYEDFDFAADKLPASYTSGEIKRATKGAALGLKARYALFFGDWPVARTAAKACIDLGEHALFPDFRDLFLSKTNNPSEIIFAIPRSVELGRPLNGSAIARGYITRNAGGYSSRTPSWDLFASFLCSDGLPIDESPLFDPRKPFENRDPRCNMSIVPFQTEWLGYMYQPHPDSITVLNFTTGKYQKNNDAKSVNKYASYNGLVWKKWVDDDWKDRTTDIDKIILRYADVLLMYAEASIELNQIDESVLDAINMVRARAYKVDKDDMGNYPAITTTDQVELRKILRTERRMELADEGIRYLDIIRWRIAEKVLNQPIYGMLEPADLREKITSQGLWFWPETPQIDEDGTPDFSSMFNAGLIRILAVRNFDISKQYLWPIPTKEILINDNIKQNPNY